MGTERPLTRGWAVAALMLVAFSGCATTGTAQTADTIGAGKVEASYEFGGTAGHVGLDLNSAMRVSPAVTGTITYGATDWLDLSLRAGTSGLGAQTKLRLLDGGVHGLSLAVAPLVSAGYAVFERHLFASLPLIADYRIRNDLDLLVSPMGAGALVDYSVFDGAAGNARRLFAGGSVGIAFRGAQRTIIPEVSVLAPVWTDETPTHPRFGDLVDPHWMIAATIAVR